MTRNFARLLVLSCVALMTTLSCVGYWLFLDKSSDAGTGLAFGDTKTFDAGEYHTLAIKNGKLYAWGSNQYGQVGNKSTTNISYPVSIGQATNWASVAAGNLHSLAINENGELYAWGQNTYGQLGLGNTTNKNEPTKVGTATNWVMAAAGVGHSLAINEDGGLFTWGLNDFGQLGNNTTVDALAPIQIGLGQQWVFVEAGYIHSYAIDSNGNLFSWGANGAGQLGLGDTDDRHEPEPVGSDVWKTISAGTLHTLAIDENDTVFAWGDNSCGQVGEAFGEQVLSPNETPYQATAITAGHNHSIVIADGKISAWGDDELGQFDGNEENFGSNFVSIVAGNSHSIVMDADGILSAWGNNEFGQLGDGTNVNSSVLRRVLPFLSVSAPTSGVGFTVSDASVSELRPYELGSFTFEITRDVGYNPPSVVLTPTKGNIVLLETIGYTSYYEVSNVSGSINDADFNVEMTLEKYSVSVPDEITGLSVSSPSQSLVEYGSSYSFTVTVSDDYADPMIILSVNGDLAHTATVKGEDTKTLTYTISNVAGIINQSDFIINIETLYTASPTTLSIGQWHSLTIINGELWAWGNNSSGQLGTDDIVAQSYPVRVGSENNWVSVAVGELHSLALNLSGELYAWGDNIFGQLGNGENTNVYSPIQIGEGQTWVSIFASGNVSYAINNLGELFAWGNNSNGQIGDGTTVNKNIPTKVGVTGSWITVTGGYDFTLAIDVYGRLFAWGGNGAGQLGSGDTVSRLNPMQVGTDDDWEFVSAGTLHVLALKSNGTLYAWGTNESGQLGFGNTIARLIPEMVGSANDWVSISAGHNHSLATNSNGELFAWGRNAENQFGNGNTTSNNNVTKIGTDTNWAKVSAGYSSSIAMKTNGKIYAAGNNTYNQIGDGTTVAKNSWINILPLLEVTPPNTPTGAIIDGLEALVTPSGSGTYTFTITSQEGYTNGSPSVTLTSGKGTLGTPVKNGNVTTYTITSILDNITISDFTVLIPYDVSAPNPDTGFTVQGLAKNWVMPNETYDFTITKNSSYSDPIVTIDGSLATISAPVVDGNNFTFTVSNITAPISASDFSIYSELVAHIVASPYSVDGCYLVSSPSENPIGDGESYTFTVTKSNGYANPIIELNQNGSVALTSEEGNVLTYTVSNVIGQISSNDFTFTPNVIVTVPSSATGYTISDLSKTVVAVGDSFTFVIEAENGYNNKAPLVTLRQNGTLTNVGTLYTVSNVTGPITADDFNITVYVNVYAPESATGFAVVKPAQNWVEYGASYTFTITPAVGYNNKEPLVEYSGAMLKIDNSYTIDNVTSSISADDFTITIYVNIAAPTSNTGYDVSVLAQNWVEYGEEYTFTVTPQAGFTNKAPTVTFGGTMSEDGNTYTISNVTTPITASNFTITAYVNIANPASEPGIFVVSTLTQNWVEYNGSYSFTVTPQEGYTETPPTVTLMSLNGTLEKTSETDGVILYTVKNVTGPIVATDFTVTESIDVSAPTSTPEYIVSGTSVNSVLYGGSYTFTVTPQSGYDNNAPLIVLNRNGTLSNVGNNYTVSGVTGPITPADFTITVYVNVAAPTSDTGYSVNLSKNWAERGGSYTFTITPQAGYNNNDPLVTFGGTMSKSDNTYTVSNVTNPITASDFTVTVYLNVEAPTSDTGYTVSNLSTTWVANNGTYTFTVAPQADYNNKAPNVTLLRNGLLSNVDDTYTVYNVSAPISASDFEITAYFNVAAPASDDGFTVGSLSQNWAEFNGSYTFTVTRQPTYTFPNIIFTGNGTMQSSKVGNVVTYTVSNVTGPIYTTDFSIHTEVRTYQISYRGLEEATAPALNSYTYEQGVSLVGIAPSERDSHNFVGWSLTQDGAIITEIIPAQSGDVILWANWEIKVFTASFDSRGGNTINSLTIEYGNNLPEPVNPYKTGFYFDGWETAAGTAWNFETSITQTTTLYAKWIRLYFELAYEEVVHNPLPTSHTYGTATTLPTPSKDNHDFAGWYIGNTKLTNGIIPVNFLPQSLNGIHIPGSQVTITAQWTAHTYTITFENVDPNVSTVKQTKVLNFSELPYALQPLDDTEYWLFKNWLDNTYVPISGQVLTASDFTDRKITVRAFWTEREMTVVFKSLTKGKFQDGTTVKTFTIPYNSFVTEEIPTSTKIDGVASYHFKFWQKQNADLSVVDEPFNPNTTRITENLTLIAHWRLNTDAVKNILVQLGINDETDIPSLESRYDDPNFQEELNELVRLVKRAITLTETDRIDSREAVPADVKTLEGELITAIVAMSVDREELENKMTEHTYLGYLIADMNEYKSHSDYTEWHTDLDYLLGKAGTLYATFISDASLIDLTNMTAEILTFFEGKNVDVYERNGYDRPEPPFTFANPELIQELQSIIDALVKYTQSPLNAKLTEALSVTLTEEMGKAQTHLDYSRVLNSELSQSISELSQIQTAIYEHLANLVSSNTLQDLDTTIQDATDYSDDNDIWSKIGTTLKNELDALILEAKSSEAGYDDPMLYQARTLYLIVKLNEAMDKIDTAITDYGVWKDAYDRLETLMAEIDEYLATMEDSINKLALVAARATAQAILDGEDTDLQDLTTAYYEAMDALDSAKNPVDVPPSNNDNNLLMYIIFGIAAIFAITATIMIILALKKKGKRERKKPDSEKPKPSDSIIKNKTNSKAAWTSAESD